MQHESEISRDFVLKQSCTCVCNSTTGDAAARSGNDEEDGAEMQREGVAALLSCALEESDDKMEAVGSVMRSLINTDDDTSDSDDDQR